jgi:hypothetical protein
MRPALLTLCFALVVLGAKAATWILTLVDGGGRGLRSAWAPFALFAQDLWLIALFGALVALTWRTTRTSPRVCRVVGAAWWLLYGIAAVYVAVNIPVARLFSGPATYALLQGAGGALGDSFAAYATPANIAFPLALIALAALLPSLLRRLLVRLPTTWLFWAPVLATWVIALAVAPRAARSVTTLGLHRNAIVALVTTTIEHHVTWGKPKRPPPVELVATGEADDLTALAGTAAGRNVVTLVLRNPTVGNPISTFNSDEAASNKPVLAIT